jgi:hypothetical protein
MDFYAVLDRVIELLRSRGRVTYGALKLHFGLDNEQLEVLKDEIISAQRLAMDEDGRILVWTGDGEGTPDAASPSAPPTQQAPLQQDQPSQKSAPSLTSKDKSVIFSGAPRRSPWDYGTARGRTRGTRGSANACRYNRRTVV